MRYHNSSSGGGLVAVAIFLIWAFTALASLAGTGLVLWVIWHFVTKYW